MSKCLGPFLVSALIALAVSSCTGGELLAGSPPTRAPTEPPTEPPAAITTEVPEHEGCSLGDTQVRPTDGMVMVCVPAGEFQMGSPDGESDERPVHTVALDGFWIDETEVTNGRYAQCVAAGACDPPASSGSRTHTSYYGDSAYDDSPVIYVSWDDAVAYCTWASGRLPTEAEWEYAARGPEGRTYPWGDDQPDCSLANYGGDCVGDTITVGSYPAGASWIGALDLAGNVWEWVADWYWTYPSGRQENPTGPASGGSRLVRGGSWGIGPNYVRAAGRDGFPPVARYYGLGFRCARSSE